MEDIVGCATGVGHMNDQCLAKQMIYGKQCTILWHVDDLKITHAVTEVVGGIIKILNKKFGKENALTTTWSKVLEYGN